MTRGWAVLIALAVVAALLAVWLWWPDGAVVIAPEFRSGR